MTSYHHPPRECNICDLDSYTVQHIASILHQRGRAMYISSQFSTTVDEWRDIRAFRASCRYFAQSIRAPKVPRKEYLSQLYVPSERRCIHRYIGTSRILHDIFSEHFSAQSIEPYRQTIDLRHSIDKPITDAIIAAGSVIDRVMRACASSGHTDWSAIHSALFRELVLRYGMISIDVLDITTLAYDIIARTNDARMIILHFGDEHRNARWIMRAILDKRLIDVMRAYGIVDRDHERICELLDTCDPTSVRAVCVVSVNQESDEIMVTHKWSIHNFRAILDTDVARDSPRVLRERCATLFEQFPDIDIRYETMSPIDRETLFLRDNPIRDIMVKYMFDKLGLDAIKYIAYHAIFSPFISYDEMCANVQLWSKLFDARTQGSSATESIIPALRDFHFPRETRVITGENGAQRTVVSIRHDDELDQHYNILVQIASVVTIQFARSRMSSIKSLCVLYLTHSDDISQIFEQFPRKIDIEQIITSIKYNQLRIESYGIDVSEMMRKFINFRRANYA